MTCNNIILAKPEAGASVPYTLPAGESARLSFGPGEISGLSMGDNGGLVIRFVEGGELTLTNFQSMVDGGNLLYLSDGTLVDPAVLQASLASGIAPAAGADAIVVGIPAENETKEYAVEAGKNYVLDFDIDTPVSATKQNGNFVMTFENGGLVVLRGYETAMASADAPTITSSSKVCVYENEELITNIQALAETLPAEKVVVEEEVEAAVAKKVAKVEASDEDVANVEPAAGEPTAQQVANIEPAAGEAPTSNSGYGFNSTPGTEPLGSLDDVGPIDPTLLNYGVEFLQEENRLPVDINNTPNLNATPSATLDETNLAAGSLIANGRIIVDFGNDGIGGITPNGAFGAGGSIDNGVLASGGVPIAVTQTVNGYEGYAGNTLVFTFTINPLTGAYTYTQVEPFDHADPLNPNDVIRLEFGIVARDADGDEATTSVRIDVLDDAPVVDSTGNSVDETDLAAGTPVTVGGQVVYSFGQDTPNNGFAGTGTFASSGSQLGGKLTTAGGAPVTVAFDAATGTYTGTATVGGVATKIFSLKVNADGTYSFTLFEPLDHADKNDANDIIHLDFGVGATDYDGDRGINVIRIDVKDDVPVIGDSSGDVDESNFDAGNLVYSDTVSHNFGVELGSIRGNGTTSSSDPTLTSNGAAVVISLSGNTYTGKAGNVTVFTLTIDPATGKYTYTQFANLDHPDATNNDDVISINFGVTIQSVDGTTDTGTITINVADDGPVANNDYSAAEESQVITGNVVANDDLSTDSPNLVTQVVFNGTTYTPTAGVITVPGAFGTLVMKTDGTYTYTAKADVPNNVTNVDKFTYTLRDDDGDRDTAELAITVTDDGTPTEYPGTPSIGDDTRAVDETALSAGPIEFDGSVAIDYGLDGQGTAGGVNASGSFASGGSRENGVLSSGGKPVTVSLNAATNTYTGTANGVTVFTLKINADGTYKFTLLETLDHDDSTDPNDIINLNFGVEIADADGDTADGNILIRVYDDAPVAIDDAQVTVKGTASVTGDVTSNDSHSNDGPNLVVSVNGVAVAPTGNTTIVGTFGTLVINSAGAYTYTPKNSSQVGIEQFTYTLQDSDGDRDTANFSFNVLADFTPVITQVGGAELVDETNLSGGVITETGTLSVNYFGETPAVQDVNGTGTFSFNGSALGGKLTHNGVAVNVTYNAATDTYTGKAGTLDIFTLKIDSNGAYTFKLLENLDHADGNNANDQINLVFGVSAKDADGDIGTGTMTIIVRDDAPAVVNATGLAQERLLNTGTQSVTGSVASSFGQDGAATAGALIGNGTFNATGEVDKGVLSHKGTPIVVSYNAASGTYVGMAGTLKVFDLVLNNNGSYKFNLYDTMDHGDRSRPDEIITLNFGVKLKDYDGDTTDGFIRINVEDDGPRIISSDAARMAALAITPIADETNLSDGAQDVNGKVNVDFGNDGPASVDPFIANGTFQSTGSVAGATLTSQGEVVTVSHLDGTYTGTAGGRTIFTFTIDDQGNYKFTLLDTLDHADGKNPDDIITLGFGIRATDEDGDYVDTSVRIDVKDDAPVAKDDNGGTTSGTNTKLTGNVVANDTAGQDGATTVTQVKFGTTTVNVPATGTISVVGTYGTLVIGSNGAYTYTAKNGANGTDKFAYTIKDFDGDTSSAVLTVVAKDGTPEITDNGSGSVEGAVSVDETSLSGGTITKTGKVTVDYGSDGAGSVAGNGSFSSSGSQTGGKLSYNGTAVTVTYANGVYTGKAGSTTIFTMTIAADGSYSFKQFQQLDHADGANPNDAINLNFGITASDKDGDKDAGTIVVKVLDDAPVAKDDNGGTTSGTNPKLTGNVMTNDATGQDTAVTVTAVKFGTQTIAVPATGNITIVGAYGTLVINSTGAYTYTAKNLANGTDAFTYTIKDFDGDTSSAVLTVVAKDGVPTAVNDTNTVDEGKSVTANVTTNDSAGTDSPATVTTVKFGTKTYTVPATGTVTIVGEYGTLVIGKTGAYTYTANKGENGKDIFTYTLVDADGDSDTATLTITSTDTGVPVVVNAAEVVDETSLSAGTITETGKVSVNYNGDAAGSVSGNGSFSSNGSQTGGKLSYSGTAVTVTYANGVYTGKAGSTTIFTMTINADGTYSYKQFQQLDHADGTNANDAINLVFGVVATDKDGDKGTGTITVKVLDDAPLAVNVTGSVQERQLNTGTQSATGSVASSFGQDGAAKTGAVVGNGTFSATGEVDKGVLSHKGTAIVVSYNASTGTYVGMAGSVKVFDLVLSNNGTYKFNLYQTMDHGDRTRPDEIITLNFGVKLKDFDGDTKDGTIRINVSDDGPRIVSSASARAALAETPAADETDLKDGNQNVTGKVVVDFGNDGPAAVDPFIANGNFQATGSVAGGSLTSQGQAVTITHADGVYTGKAGSRTIFTFTIDDEGNYKFTLLDTLDHADKSDPNDIITLGFGIRATDEDGDFVDTYVRVDVKDDGPVAVADAKTVDEGKVVTGNVVTNDTESQDGPTLVTKVTIGSTTVNVPATGNVTIVGTYGTLVINSRGEYTYTAKNGTNGVDKFNYTITDRDGDTSTTTLTITTKDTTAPVVTNGSTSVDETNLADGTITQTGKVTVNYGPDAPGSVAGNGSFSSNGSQTGGKLSYNGAAVTVSYADGVYTAKAGSTTIFTMTIAADGSYSFKQFQQLDHADGTNPNDSINLVFGVVATDKDGDKGTGTITVKVLDDAPVAKDDNGGSTKGTDATLTGNVMTNDTKGQDTAVTVTKVTFGSQTVNVPATGTISIVGTYGTLVIGSNGAYTYTAKNGAEGTDKFTYTIKDYDGDTDTAVLTVATKDGEPEITDNGSGTATGSVSVDETSLASGAITKTGKVTVDYGSDGAGSVTANGSFSSSGSQTGGKLSYNGTAVTVTYANGVYTGKAGSVTVFTMTIAADGSYSFKQFQQLDHADGSNPNDAINLNFGITASDKDGDKDNGTIVIKVLDDAPVAKDDNGGTTSGTNTKLTGNVMTNDTTGQDTAVTVTQVKFGTQTINVPATGNVTVVGTYGTLVINSTGAYTYTAKNGANGTDKFTYTIKDYDGDTDTAVLTVAAKDGEPEITNNGSGTATGSVSVDETSLASGAITKTGKVTVDYGSDGAGSVTANGSFSSSGSREGGKLSYLGTAVTVTYANGVYTGKAGSVTVFTMTIAADGSYSFKLLQQLDHADATDPNDAINLNFGITATDKDGDKDNGTIVVKVLDDAPVAKDDNGGSTKGTDPTLTGNVMTNDTKGQDTTTNVTAVQFGTKTYTVPASGTLKIVGEYGTLEISKSGAYTYTAKNLANGTDKFTYTITDGDGDKDTAILTVAAKDGTPTAKDDTNSVNTNQTRVTGNILTNDTAGPDGGLKLLTVGTFDGRYGTLVVKTDGSYTYTRKSNAGGTDSFTYSIQDADGDKDSATLKITVATITPPRPPIGDGGGDGGGDGCPLVLDLNGNGIDLISKENGVNFDIDNDGVADKTAWVGKDDALLAIDHNGDGVINDRSELFGDTNGFTDGFDKLASYDDNGDGVIDAKDAVWSDLIVWQDLNQDGKSDANEMLTLEQVGIVGMRLTATMPEGVYIEGSWISHVSSYILADGTEREIVDAWFGYDKGYTAVETEGLANVYGDDGADAFLFTAIGEVATTVHNFNVAEGDKIDLSSILQTQDDVTDAINDFVYLRQEGGDTVISVDVTGSGDISQAVDIARLDGLADLDIDSLLQNGNIVV